MARGFEQVTETQAELDQWRRRNPGRWFPSVMRLACMACGKRIWGSGLGIGSHLRACKEQEG